MTNIIVKGALALALTTGAFSASAMAGDKAELNGWVGGASSAVDDVMTYPARAVESNVGGSAVLRVTVNRDGDVVASDFIKKSNHAVINTAARRVVKKADFPALPANYAGKDLTFAVKLQYALASSYADMRRMQRAGTVTGEEVAMNGNGKVASIEILDTASGR